MNTHAISVDGNAADPSTGNVVSRPYLSYVALLTQTGTNAPVEVAVFENTIGPITYTRYGAGNYRGTAVGKFTVGSTFVLHNQSNWVDNNVTFMDINDTDSFFIVTNMVDPWDSIDGLLRHSIEIRVYQ